MNRSTPFHLPFDSIKEQRTSDELSKDYTTTGVTELTEREIKNESLHRQHQIEVKRLGRNQLCSAVLDLHQQASDSQQEIDELKLERKILTRILEENKQRNLERSLITSRPFRC